MAIRYMLRPNTRELNLLSENHSAALTAVAFPSAMSDRFGTASEDGTIRVWDLNDYSVMSHGRGPDGVLATCLGFASECVVVSGWSDGMVRTFDGMTGDLLWTIRDVHPDGVTALAVKALKYISNIDIQIWL